MEKEMRFYERHVFKNVSLIILSLMLLPLSITMVALCYLRQSLHKIRHQPAITARTSSNDPMKTILVSSLTMTKGLVLSRSFHLAGHRVIGLDFSPRSRIIPSASGRFSKSLSGYYELPLPVDSHSQELYNQGLLRIIRKEKVDMWVCVSGVGSTIEDAKAKEFIERECAGSCRVFQFLPETCATLHNKDSFIANTAGLGLPAPETRRVESRNEAFDFLLREGIDKGYVLKCVELDDVSRGDMTLFPRPTEKETCSLIEKLDISPERPWLLQEFVQGEEYCTHAVVVRGKVKAFVACSSSEFLMHYEMLSPESTLSKSMLEFTQHYAHMMENGQMTGQLSFDFIVKVEKQPKGTESGHGDGNAEESDISLFLIECNPRTHTAVVLFTAEPEELAASYISLIQESLGSGSELPSSPPVVFYPTSQKTPKFYWIGHDIVSLVIMPFIDAMTFHRPGARSTFFKGVGSFLKHALLWKDPTLEVWDPVPFLWLYHVYWPGVFLWSLFTGNRWSRVNVSTTKVFEM